MTCALQTRVLMLSWMTKVRVKARVKRWNQMLMKEKILWSRK